MTSYLLPLPEFHAAMRAATAHAKATIRFTPGETMLISGTRNTAVALATVPIISREGDDAEVFEFPADEVKRVLAVFKLPPKDVRYAARIRVRPIDPEPDIDGTGADPGAVEFVEEWNEAFHQASESTPTTLVMPRAFDSGADVRPLVRSALELPVMEDARDAYLDPADVAALATAAKATAHNPALRMLRSASGNLVVLATLGEMVITLYATDTAPLITEGKMTYPERARELWMLEVGAQTPVDVDEFLAWTTPKKDAVTDDDAPMPGQGELPLDGDDDGDQDRYWE